MAPATLLTLLGTHGGAPAANHAPPYQPGFHIPEMPPENHAIQKGPGGAELILPWLPGLRLLKNEPDLRSNFPCFAETTRPETLSTE